MQQQDEKNTNGRQSCKAPAAVSVLDPRGEQRHSQHRCRGFLTPKKFLTGSEICSRFDQVSGQGLPKRMTTGKFVYLGPTQDLPDSPLR